MATPKWQISGDYSESCSCDFVCPCLLSNFAAKPTHGHCYFAMGFQVERGRYGDVALDGVAFAIVGRTPGVMGEGNWSVGLIVDSRANAGQRDAITGIVSGQAGGPMAALGPLIGNFLGVESKPIRFEKRGMRRSVSIADALDQTVEGVPSAANPNETLVIDHTAHPANARLALAKATTSHLSAFGLTWDDASGRNNGHFAPFAWQG
ncbi:MAG TPA: DUF1326 domain-containing protein [Methylomirabilota bacterium]|jgi:hypothetical protein|nr:DUF1326 domain-containing protein [Methylomirabilota bacterium]